VAKTTDTTAKMIRVMLGKRIPVLGMPEEVLGLTTGIGVGAGGLVVTAVG